MSEFQSRDAEEPVRFTVPPGFITEVVMRTRPHGVCSVHAEDAELRERDPLLFADADGLTRLRILPGAESRESVELVVRCTVDDRVTLHPVELRFAFEPTEDMPAPPRTIARPEGRVRPGLSDDDARRLPVDELLARGYPPRPDPGDSPGAFMTWRRGAMATAVEIEPLTFPHPYLGGGLAQVEAGLSSSRWNWSGYELRDLAGHSGRRTSVRPFGPYDHVMGTWQIPFVAGHAVPLQTTYSSLWVGLDGDSNLKDLWQAGTEQDIAPGSVAGLLFWIPTTFAWTELLPQQKRMKTVKNFPAQPGDEIYVHVWMGDVGSPPSLDARTGSALFQNITQQVVMQVHEPLDDKAPKIGGTQAEWIMERPQNPDTNEYFPLADYHTAVVRDAYARESTSPPYHGYIAYQDDPNLNLTMRSLDYRLILSRVTALDATSMRFHYGDPRFGPFG